MCLDQYVGFFVAVASLKSVIESKLGKGTAILRNLVLPRVLQYFVNILEWIESSFLNIEMLLCGAKFDK